ncbi:hypothetical protein N752_01010 [Desulforamulus aquiferis]|nr:hypothetical protein [Desulforamulus aquiferis]RYD07194.1 hypothetical protein N752_01010 [Desulforamulus aquiferis]
MIQNDSLITFKMTGRQFDDGFNLYYILRTLENFHTIIDKSYLTINNKKKMSEKDRDILRVRAFSFEKGSFITNISIDILAATQIVLPYFFSLTPNEIWQLILQGYDYLTFVLKALSKNENIRIEPSGQDNQVNVINGDNNQVIKINKQTLVFVQKAVGDYENLVNNVNPKRGINQIQVFQQPDSKGINITDYEKKLFQGRTIVEKEPVTFIGKVYRIDGIDFRGRLIILKSTDSFLEIGKDYEYEMISKEELDYLTLTFMQTKTITAIKEITIDPVTLKKRIKKLNIISIED